MDSDIFDINLLEEESSDKLAIKLNDIDHKLKDLRLKLFNDIYENLIKTISNSNKYLKRKSCIYTLPSVFNGIVIYKELSRIFMKHIIIRLCREKFKVSLLDKKTILVSW